MADKAISELVAAQQITATDMFVLEQNGTAKKLTGQVLLNWLTAAADGHGGISKIEKLSTSGLLDTYRITLADQTTFDFVVTNGRGITSITKTSTSGLVDTYTIKYSDNTSAAFTVTNGAKGDKGDNTYTWIKYASQEPTAASHSFGDVPDNWIGVYFGSASTAPTDWTQYKWFKIKGEPGNTGAPAALVSSAVEYLTSDSGTVIPSGSWTATVPSVAQGKYLWTRVTQRFNSGDPVVSYSVSRMGIDGLGSVQSVGGISPGSDGNVALKPKDIGALATDGSNAMAAPFNAGGFRVTNVAAPTSNNDAVPKAYVDNGFAQKDSLGSYLNSVLPYYTGDAIISADDLLVPTALIDLTPDYNSELYNLFSGSGGITHAYVITLFWPSVSVSSSRMQIALSYYQPARMAIRTFFNGNWTAWNHPGFDVSEAYHALFRKIDGVAQYLNPPIFFGAEYCTLERYGGQPVYTKLVNLGTLPSSATKTVGHGLSGVTVVRYQAFADNGSLVQEFPFHNTAGAIVGKVYYSADGVKVITYDDLSAYTGVIQLWYTK